MSIGDSASEVGKVRGLGSAREGGSEWMRERLTSLALLLLGAWFLVSLLLLPKLDQRSLVEWLRGAGGAVPMALFVITAFWHSVDGLKQVTEDYIPDDTSRWFVNTVIFFFAVAGASLCLFALGKITFGAAA
jgi:succinate dehydrogenase / fumarate reductase membrane anchor subunit